MKMEGSHFRLVLHTHHRTVSKREGKVGEWHTKVERRGAPGAPGQGPAPVARSCGPRTGTR